MKKVICVRVASSTRGGENDVASPVTPCGRATLPTGEGKGVGDTPETVKPGERMVVDAMRAKQASQVTMPDDPEVVRLKGELEKAQDTVRRLKNEVQYWKNHFESHGEDLCRLYDMLQRRDDEIDSLRLVVYLKDQQIEELKQEKKGRDMNEQKCVCGQTAQPAEDLDGHSAAVHDPAVRGRDADRDA